MKKTIIWLCLCALFLLVPSCGGQATPTDTPAAATTPAPPAATDAGVRQPGEVTIKVTMPAGWTKNTASVLPVHYQKDTATFMAKEEPFESDTLDAVVTEAVGYYKDAFDDFSVEGEAEPLTVDEKDARKLVFTSAFGGIKMKFLYVYVFAADNTYVMSFGDLADHFDQLSGDFDSIINTIKFET